MALNTKHDILSIEIADPKVSSEQKNARILRLEGKEGISQLYEFRVHFSHTHKEKDFLDLNKLIGKEVKIKVQNHETGEPLRHINGLVKSAHIGQLKKGSGAYTESDYHIEIVPKLWFLTQTKDCKIFQDKTIEDILKEVLDEFDIKHELKLEDPIPYSPYKYCVQYQESPYNFLQRLMEQEGLYYYFDHSETETKLIIADHSNYTPIEGDTTTIEWGEYGSVNLNKKIESYKPVISKWYYNEQSFISRVAKADFDYFQPPAPLLAGDLSYEKAARKAEDIFDYPAKFEKKSTPEKTEKLKKVLEEQLQTYKSFYRGISNCISLKPGYIFELAEFPDEKHNQEYLITALHTIIVPQEMGQRNTLGQGQSSEGVEFRFLGIPVNEPTGAAGGMSGSELGGKAGGAAGKHYAGPIGEKYGSEAGAAAGGAAEGAAKDSPAGNVVPSGGATKKRQFRPQIMTPKPVIDGIQTAIVVGPQGEEIHTDEYGRIKVVFPWDREFYKEPGKKPESTGSEKRSCWIRVTQSLAGPGWGGQFIPRIGQEVVVTFVNGDPDRPLITGTVYNIQTGLPYPLPNEKFKNGLRSRSEKGNQATFNEMFFDDTQGSELVQIKGQKDIMIEANQKITLKVGGSVVEITPGNIKVNSSQIDVKGSTVNVEGSSEANIKGGTTNVKGGKININ